MKPAIKIGLFGGTFNPAHNGHLHVAETSLKALDLDQIWWLVSPGNPLKNDQTPYESRVASVKALGLPNNMYIKHIERDFGTQYTIDTLRKVRKHWPNKHFVFLMGADNLHQLPKWKDWKAIFKTMPLAIIARPGAKTSDALKARLSPPARIFANHRLPEHQAHTLAMQNPPAWVYLTPALNELSSSAIRAQKQ